MKKTLTILTILAIALVAMMGSVNAATFEGSENAVVNGDVSVTIRVKASGSIDSRVNYDTNLVEYVGAEFDNQANFSAKAVKKDNGLIIVSAFATDDEAKATLTYVTLKFKAKAAGEAVFTIEDGSFDTNTKDTLDNSEVKVTITEAQQPSGGEQQQPGEGSTSDGGQTSDEGQQQPAGEQDETPKTGTPVYVVGYSVLALAVVALVVMKVRK